MTLLHSQTQAPWRIARTRSTKRGLTPPSKGQPKARCAAFGPPLMSNVGTQDTRHFNPKAKLPAKVLLAAVLIGFAVVIAGRSLAPSLPFATLLSWCAIVVVAFLVVSVLWVAINLRVGQWVLQRGGTDPQWF